MLRLILGAAASGKTSMITNEIAGKVHAGERGIIMLVPEQYSHEAERELCKAAGDALSLGAELLSFSRLAVRVAQETGTGARTYLDAGGRLLCMSLAIKQVASSLRLFTGAARRGRLQLEILKAVDELKNACIGYGELMNAAGECGGELSLKLMDLALCLEAYESVLSQGYADPADRILRLAGTIGESGAGKNGQIYIDGFTDFTGAQERVIEALIEAGAPVTVCLTCDSLSGDSEHFGPARRAANSLMRFAEKCGSETRVIVLKADTGKDRALHFYDEHLFLYTSKSLDDEKGALSVNRSPDITSECEFAAARCLALVRRTGCRWRDIAIAARGFDDYGVQLEEAFRFYGVPLFTARRGSLLQKPLPALISAAFSVISGGWDTDDVLAYIKTGLTGLSPDDCDDLARYLVMWRPGSGAWLKKSAWKQHPHGLGKPETDGSRALLERIDRLRRALAGPLLRLAENGAGAASAGEQVRALSDFLLELNLPATLEKHSAELENAGRAQLADEFSQLWRVLCRAMEQFDALLGTVYMDQDEFSELFIKMLSCYDLASIPLSPDCVTAGEIDRMRRRHIKHLIVLGASDDRIPGVAGNAGLLSEDDRALLETLGLPALGAGDALEREFSLIYNCVSLPSESLTLSYCAFSGEGAAAGPSFLISRAKLLFGTKTADTDLDKLRLAAPEPAFLLASRQEGGCAPALARAYFSATQAGRARLDSLFSRAKLSRSALSKAGVEALYGKALRISPSRADAFFSCKYYYFLRYGLRLNEKETAGFDPPELGSFMHYVLEKCAAEISEGVGFRDASPELAGALADKYTDLYIKEKLDGFEDKSPRFIFLFERLRPSVKRVVTDMVRELSRSDFTPLRFELAFGEGGDLPPIRLSDGRDAVYINGTADRVDGCWKDGKLLLRVVDYKTGKKSFSLSDVWYGMGMQMLLYLFSLERGGSALFGGEIVPAGVLYVPARDNLIPASGDMDDESLSAEKAKALRRSGLLLDDKSVLQAMERSDSPEYLPVKYKNGEVVPTDALAGENQLRSLKSHVDRRLLALSRELSGGRIDAEPCYKNEGDNACLFCPYKSVCRFDEARDSRRYMKKLKASEFWRRLGGGEDE